MVWAFDIEAEQLPDGRISVFGKMPVLDGDPEIERDAYHRYLSSVKVRFGQKSTGLLSPHVRFANAVSDADLLEFVREFGPIAARDIAEEADLEEDFTASTDFEEHAKERGLIGAYETLSSLRNEHRIYAAALGLLSELKRDEDKSQQGKIREYISEIADCISSWPKQWLREKQWRDAHSAGPILWHFDALSLDYIWRMKFAADCERSAPRREDYPDSDSYREAKGRHSVEKAMRTTPHVAAQQVLCKLINSFPTETRYIGDYPVDTLPLDALKFGIRPSLYLILKHVCFGQSGTNICRNDRCNRFFVSQREGQVFCGSECSQKHRQRIYWATKGSPRRKRRRAALRAATKKKKSRNRR